MLIKLLDHKKDKLKQKGIFLTFHSRDSDTDNKDTQVCIELTQKVFNGIP